MASLSNQLNAAGMRVELGGHSAIPEHGQDDVAVCREIAELCDFPVQVDEDCEVSHLWARYGELDLVIGARLHSCIMAAAVGTPVVVLGYQEKAKGVASMMGPGVPFFWVDDLPVETIVLAARATLQQRMTASTELKHRIRASYEQ
ncbi:polysaccharide pyruvyl transferase WcaK-like protein [Mycetocola sp. CAN_C7]